MSHYDEDQWHEAAMQDERLALSAWAARQREDIARRAKSQALRNRERYMREQRAIWRSMIQRVEPGPSSHWLARAWRRFTAVL